MTDATLTTPASASVVATSTDEIEAAIALLAAGDGGTVYVANTGEPLQIRAKNLGAADAPVIIRPLDPDTPPVIEEINFYNAQNLTVTGMTVFSGAYADQREAWINDVTIRQSENIQLIGNVMTGTADGMYIGEGGPKKSESLTKINDSSGIAFIDNEISNYFHGIGMTNTTDITIVGNEIYGMQGDGIRGGGWQNALVEGNHLHSFFGSLHTLNHDDMIQIWGTGNVEILNKDIEIRGNFLDSAGMTHTQGIHIRNEAFGTEGVTGGYFENITVADNVIHNSQANGIRVNDTIGVEIVNNTLLWDEAGSGLNTIDSTPTSAAPRIVSDNAQDRTIANNVTTNILIDGAQSNAGNYIVTYDDPASSAYIHKHIVNLSGLGAVDLVDLSFRSDSPLFGTYGAALSSTAATLEPMVAVFSSDDLMGNRLGVTLSAEHSTVDGALIDPSATVSWTFADGTVMEGLTVTRVFETAGVHDVTLDITTLDGRRDSIERQISVEAAENFQIDFASGGQDTSGRDSIVSVEDPDADAFVDLTENGSVGLLDSGPAAVFRLDGENRFEVTRDNAHLYNLDTFTIDVSFQHEAGTVGSLAYLHKVIDLRVTADGGVDFKLTTDQGSFQIVTEDGLLSGAVFHDIKVAYDGPFGLLQVLVDDVVVGQTDAFGQTPAQDGHGMVLGNTFKGALMGMVGQFSMTVPPSQIYADDTPPPGEDDPDQDPAYALVQDILALEATIEDEALAFDGVAIVSDGGSTAGTQSSDMILGADGARDVIEAGYGQDIVLGGGGSDTVSGGAQGDSLSGGAGKDLLRGDMGSDKIAGGAGDDVLDGGHGRDQLVGGAGNDVLIGGGLQDILIGGEGDDTLVGGTSDDILIAGPGLDILQGDKGADYFVFDAEFGADVAVIADFTVGLDSIVLGTLASLDADKGFADFKLGAEQVGEDVVYTAPDGSALTLQNVQLAELTAAHFTDLDHALATY